ncbi:hypothetical protein T05_14825 [Trichinella murrelli]|uniref:Uncharacterized protein n=1 Tax=Trichinella murrelli TaxID=144512 RepID=A0A0V0TKI5_9BILA|nr:hypothetical protein T05_14825 [Trichinella murrelli]
MRTVAPCGWRSRSIDKLDIDRQSCRLTECVINLILARNCISRAIFAAAEPVCVQFPVDTAAACQAFPTLVCSFWPSVNHRVDLVPWDFLVSVEGKKWKKAGMFAHFFCRKAVQSFCYHMYISQWNGLTDRTSCFDRKLCTDLSWLCETSRFCSTETGVCGLMIHSSLGKLLNLSSLLTTPTVVQNCRCCVLSALSSSSSSCV